MGMETKGPPGRTFRERWPHDAAAADYLAAPWVPLALGGLGGLLAAPYVAASVMTNPVAAVGLIAAAAASTLALRRGLGGRLAGRAWRTLAWFVLIGLVGIPLAWIVGEVGGALCPAAGCGGLRSRDAGSALTMVVATGLSLVASVVLAVLVDRAGRRLAPR